MTNKFKPDKYQKKVIKSQAQNLLVIAGAGSGKTQTIIMKINSLIDKGIKSEEILCISFTKASAKDLEEKLKDKNVKVKTFHSLGYEIIKKYKVTSIVKEEKLEQIIYKEIKKNNKINQILKLPFIRIGTKDKIFDKLENNIIINTK